MAVVLVSLMLVTLRLTVTKNCTMSEPIFFFFFLQNTEEWRKANNRPFIVIKSNRSEERAIHATRACRERILCKLISADYYGN